MSTYQPLDRLRLAAALAHRIPGARLVLRGPTGADITIGRDPGDALDPCQFRRAVVASSVPGAPDLGTQLDPIALTGHPESLGGGVYATSCPHGSSRWFATLLDPDRARGVLAGITGPVPDDLVDAGLGIDRNLAVTVVRITACGRDLDAELDDLAQRAFAACCVEELVSTVRRSPAIRPRHPGSTDRR
jgi:hypothetical protein